MLKYNFFFKCINKRANYCCLYRCLNVGCSIRVGRPVIIWLQIFQDPVSTWNRICCSAASCLNPGNSSMIPGNVMHVGVFPMMGDVPYMINVQFISQVLQSNFQAVKPPWSFWLGSIWASYVKAECLCQLRYPSSSFCKQIIQFYTVSALATFGSEFTEWNLGIFFSLQPHKNVNVLRMYHTNNKKDFTRMVLRWIAPLRCVGVY